MGFVMRVINIDLWYTLGCSLHREKISLSISWLFSKEIKSTDHPSSFVVESGLSSQWTSQHRPLLDIGNLPVYFFSMTFRWLCHVCVKCISPVASNLTAQTNDCRVFVLSPHFRFCKNRNHFQGLGMSACENHSLLSLWRSSNLLVERH